jgi:integrase
VAHRRDCPNANRTALDSLEGCRCKPSYYTHHRDRLGKPVKGPRVRDRQVADRALRKLLVALDEGSVGIASPTIARRRTFNDWADEYLENLARDKGNKGSTIRAYRSTLGYARPIIGSLDLAEVGQPELRLIVRAIRERERRGPDGTIRKCRGADATVHKHLRHLRAILNGAVDEGYALSNPLARKFIKDLRLRVPRGDEPYTDVELAKLWAKMEALKNARVYIYVAKAAVVTGARLGELIALDWDDLDLTGRTLRIHRHWDRVDGMTLPKDGEPRMLNLIPPAVELFERWTALAGVQPGDSPIFPAPRSRDRLNGQYVSRRVDDAREKAGISEVGEGGRKRKPFHAFRACYARLCREQGLDPQWVQFQLGHSDPDLTLNVYGRWSATAMQAEAERAATFPV